MNEPLVARMEGNCITALSQICEEYFDQSEYSIGRSKESAVCLERCVDNWVVYEKEKNAQNDIAHYDDEQEACVDFLRRLSTISDFATIEKIFREKCKAKDGCDVYEDTMIGLLQAVSIENGITSLKEVPGMPAKTYRVPEITTTENSPLAEKTMLEIFDSSEGD